MAGTASPSGPANEGKMKCRMEGRKGDSLAIHLPSILTDRPEGDPCLPAMALDEVARFVIPPLVEDDGLALAEFCHELLRVRGADQ